MSIEFCNNCNVQLSEESIRLALENAKMTQDELVFFCPSYGESPTYHVSSPTNSEIESAYYRNIEDAEFARKYIDSVFGAGTAKIESITIPYSFCSTYTKKDHSKAAYWKVK